MGGLHTIDAAILAGYLALLLAVGFWSGRKKSEAKAEDFFLTSKTLPWYTIGFSLIAAGISSVQFIGNVGYAYQHGLAVANWEWLNAPAILLLVFIFIPVYSRWKIVTMPQFLELRYNGRVRTVFAIITLLTYIFINMAGVIYSGGFVLNKILGLDLYAGIWTMAVVSGFFVVYGGMESIAWTNVLQAVLLLGSGLLVFAVGFAAVPGGWPEIIGTGDRSHLILPANHKEIPSTGLVVLALSTNIWFFCTNQTINQSALGAKNLWHAKLGILLAGFLSIVIAFADVFPGLIAYALNPNLPVADEAYPYIVGRVIPAGLRGLVFAGLLGATLANVEALGNASATIFTFDIYRSVINPGASERQLIRIGRVAAVIVLVVGAVWAPIVMRFGHIFSYFQECWAFIAIPVAVLFTLGVLWKGVTARSALWTLCLSFPMLVLPYGLRTYEVTWNVYNVAGIVLIFTLLFTVLTSLATRGDNAGKTIQATWSPTADAEAKALPWYRSISFWAAVMAGLYVALYAIFW